jgi:hypothetical protein
MVPMKLLLCFELIGLHSFHHIHHFPIMSFCILRWASSLWSISAHVGTWPNGGGGAGGLGKLFPPVPLWDGEPRVSTTLSNTHLPLDMF